MGQVMNKVFSLTEMQTRLADLHNSNIQDCDKNSLKNLEDLDLFSYAFPGKLDEYLGDVVNPYLFKVDDVTVKMEFNCNGQKFSDALSTVIQFH